MSNKQNQHSGVHKDKFFETFYTFYGVLVSFKTVPLPSKNGGFKQFVII